MLDNLLDIEVAYSLLRGGAQDNENDPIDINYEKLKTKIEVSGPGRCARLCGFFPHCPVRIVLSVVNVQRDYVWYDYSMLFVLSFISQVVDKTTEEADIIMQYVKNTHAATHNTYTLEVQEVRKHSVNMTPYFAANA